MHFHQSLHKKRSGIYGYGETFGLIGSIHLIRQLQLFGNLLSQELILILSKDLIKL